jgi:hypothetical protein
VSDASERRGKGFFRAGDFKRLFPELANADVEYVQRGAGVPDDGKRGRLSHAERTLEGHLPCANPECRKGGFGIGLVIEALAAARRTEGTGEVHCAGYVGARRTEGGAAAGCPNRLELSVRLTFA